MVPTLITRLAIAALLAVPMAVRAEPAPAEYSEAIKQLAAGAAEDASRDASKLAEVRALLGQAIAQRDAAQAQAKQLQGQVQQLQGQVQVLEAKPAIQPAITLPTPPTAQ